MLSLASVGAQDTVYDLGSGDGRLVITAAERGARGVGIEIDRDLVVASRVAAREAGVAERVRFIDGDIFEADVGDATVVLLYLSHAFNLRLRPILLEQLRPGARIVSHAFHMGDWQPDSTVTFGSGAGRTTLYRWVVPADVDGFWLLEVEGAPPMTLELLQQFQRLSGGARGGGTDWEISDGRMNGTAVELHLSDPSVDGGKLELVGELQDGQLGGLVHGLGGLSGRRWVATRFGELTPAGFQ